MAMGALESVLESWDFRKIFYADLKLRLEVILHSLEAVFRYPRRPWNLVPRSKKSNIFYFSRVFSGLMRCLTLIFFECEGMMLNNVLGNQNIVLGRQENFLWLFEDEFHSLNFSEPDFMVAMGSEKQLRESAK